MNDDFEEETKINYAEMQLWIIRAIHRHRRSGLSIKNPVEQTRKTTVGSVWEAYDGVFTNRPSNQLMWLIQFWVLFYGESDATDKNVFTNLEKLIAEHTMDKLFAELAVGDVTSIKADLAALGKFGYLQSLLNQILF
jgi:hypothetical protein